MFSRYEKFDPANLEPIEALKNHKFYCDSGKMKIIIDETHQPESSKREDSEYGANANLRRLKSEMRYSEH